MVSQAHPVGVFESGRDYVLVAEIQPIFQIMQRHHQTRRNARSALSGVITGSVSGFELILVDDLTQ